MTPRERAKKCKSECLHLEKGACGACIERAIAAAVEEELEACAAVAEQIEGWTSEIHEHERSIAAAIRARKAGA
jgi:hypothetical protein